MAQVTVQIGGRTYQIACDDGQESHLQKLGEYIDRRAKELTAAVGQVKEGLLLAMVCLLIADELSEAYGEIAEYKKGGNTDMPGRAELDKDMAKTIKTLSERIVRVAERLDDD